MGNLLFAIIVSSSTDFIDSNIDNARNHLSYGEKNAFALILFMYDVLKNNQQLIILDDPISSFDKNKKFAIIEKLFRGDNSFKNKTVLMLTHDFEPIVDIILHHSDIFNVVKPNAYFLENIVENKLTEHNTNLRTAVYEFLKTDPLFIGGVDV